VATEQATEKKGYWEIPSGWDWRQIGDIARMATDDDNVTKEKLVRNEGKIPVISSGDLKNTKDIQVSGRTTPDLLQDLNIKLWEEPRLLLARARAETVGRVGIFRGKAVHNRGVHAIIPDPNQIDLDYLFYCFRERTINARIVEEVIVQGKSAIRKDHTRQVMIPVPPSAQQRQIVERIETLLKDAERMRFLLEKTQQDIELVRSLLEEEVITDIAKQDAQEQIERMSQQVRQIEQLLNNVEQRILSDALRGNLLREGK